MGLQVVNDLIGAIRDGGVDTNKKRQIVQNSTEDNWLRTLTHIRKDAVFISALLVCKLRVSFTLHEA